MPGWKIAASVLSKSLMVRACVEGEGELSSGAGFLCYIPLEFGIGAVGIPEDGHTPGLRYDLFII